MNAPEDNPERPGPDSQPSEAELEAARSLPSYPGATLDAGEPTEAESESFLAGDSTVTVDTGTGDVDVERDETGADAEDAGSEESDPA